MVNDSEKIKFRKDVSDMVGRYSYSDGEAVISVQVKVNKDLYNRYDVLRRLFGRSKREDYEYFMREMVDRYKSSDGGLEEHLV